MSNVPNPFASFTIPKGDITSVDYLHLLQESDGSIPGWIDQDGIPQGTLALGGGGGNVFVNGSMITNPNFISGANIAFSVAGSNITISSTGGGGGGVSSLNSLTGGLALVAGAGISVSPFGSTIALTNTGVLSVNSIAGNLTLIAGPNITLTPSGSNLTIGAASGVASLNSLLGALNITAGSGISVTPSGTSIQITNTGGAGSSNVPYTDIQSYGGYPRQYGSSEHVTTATATGGLPNVTTGAIVFGNGDGLVIYGAGAATSQSTPSAPTAAALCVQGAATLNYACVGVDALGGLTEASTGVAITNAPTVFGNLAVAISSSSVTSDVLTVNFSSAINASAGQTIHLTGIGGSGSGWNGIYIVASAPTNSSVTIALTTSDGTGTGGHGRLSNVQNITAISRAADGTITITTAEDSNYVASPSTANPAIAIIENATPADLNGEYVIQTASGNTITCSSGQHFTASGSSGSVTCYEYVYVTCPAYGAHTVAYYIYSDSPNPGGALQLIGKTMPYERGFKDYGPTLMQGYTAPAYVPTTAPVAAQNQLFGGTVLSGGGTTSLVLTTNVPNSVSGATCVRDDGQALIAALAAARLDTDMYGNVYLTPPISALAFPQYIINYPVTIPQYSSLMLGCYLEVNETITFAGNNNFTCPLGSYRSKSPQFGIGNYAVVTGLASPLIYIANDSVVMDGIGIFCGGGLTGNVNENNGQYGVIQQGNKAIFRNCFFGAGPSSTAVPCILNSAYYGSSDIMFDTCQFEGSSVFGTASVAGQSAQTPAIGNLLIHCNDQGYHAGVAQVQMFGVCSFSGRGILLDNRNWNTSSASYYQFGITGSIEYQSPNTPSIMCWGPEFFGVQMCNWLNDSAQGAIVANWTSSQLTGVTISGCTTSGNASYITGNAAYFYGAGSGIGITSTSTAILGQNVNLLLGTAGASFTTTGTTSDTLTIYGVQAGSQVMITPTNASAAADIAAGNVYVSSKSPNTVVITHGNTSGMTFDVLAVIY